MKKRLVSVVMIVLLVCTNFMSCTAQAPQVQKLGSEHFKTICIPYETDYNSRAVVKARFADTKEPISMSQTYSDRLCAIVPIEDAQREIEGFETQEIKFADYDYSFEFHCFEELSRTGVVKGNESGEALPFAYVTRAEATAMLMRLLGLENALSANAAKDFNDVSKNDWFYYVVMSAYNCGLVLGDSDTTFSPERNITREEFTVMAARAIKYAGLGYPGDSNTNAKYENKISDWAKDAYAIVGNYVNSDYDDTDPENPVRVLNPQNNATRYDVASLLYNIVLRCCIYPSPAAEQFGFDEQMPVIDGSTSTYPFTRAVYDSLFYNGYAHPSKPQSHSKSHASYQRLINGEIDMMFASVYPASDILQMAEQKGVELELIPIAYDAMIFFTNAENPATGLTSEQISNIYVNNAYQNWNQIGGTDALLYPYCRNNDSGSHAQMEKHFLNGSEIHKDIRAESTSIAMASVLTDVIDAKTTDPLGYALGYSIYYYYHNADAVLGTKRHLKLLSIDGVHPNDDTIADGSYPLSNNTYVVIRKDTPQNAPARKMAQFMLTEQGQQCVEAAGFGRLKKSSVN